jgi:hypothetical protein
MKQNLIPKITAAILLGGLFGWYIHHDEASWGLRSRDAFLAYQTHRFDMYVVSPRPVAYNLIVMALLALGVCVVYELVVSGLSAIVNRRVSKPTEEHVR